MPTHRYMSWVRFGLAATRTDGALSGSNPTITASVSVAGGSRDITVTMHGPGDVTGVASTAIKRRDPAPASIGVSPSGLVFIELVAADLPWRFSPGAASPQLLPWLALVVVPGDAQLAPRAKAPLPVLSIAAAELPDPSTAWAWAHVQVEVPPGSIGGPLSTFVRAHPELAVSRIIAPRRLEPNRAYRACLVPVFKAGRLAGLGEDASAAGTDLAWTTGTGTVELPVYDSWELQTGEVNDFETIARRLRGQDARDIFAPLAIDVASAVPRSAPLLATSFGILRPRDADGELPDAESIARTLKAWLEPQETAVVGPPLYGAAQTDATKLPAQGHWQHTLNVDPRLRAIAGGGADVVRADQETLVADARDALGRIDQANTLVRGAQLASALSSRLRSRHIESRPAARIVGMMWPLTEGTPNEGAIVSTDLLAPAMRRATRPAGPLARKRVAGVAWSRIGTSLDMRVLAPSTAAPIVTMSSVRAARPAHTMTFSLPAARRTAITRVLDVRRGRSIPVLEVAGMTPVDVNRAAKAALDAAAPLAIAKRTFARISNVATPVDLLDVRELRGAIDLSRPLLDRFAQLRPELFVPHLDALPPDSVAVLEVDPAAVEAMLVGANDELTRELAWRGVAIDRRTTLLRQVWTRQGAATHAHDIPAIAEWNQVLGKHVQHAPTVFVVRSELVRRFPNAIYACVPAVADPVRVRVPSDDYLLPMFRGLAAPDIAYVGFERSIAQLAQGLGSYLVIQERPGHIRFGLDAAKSEGTPAWTNLSWAEVAGEHYIDLDGTRPRITSYPSSPAWGASAANMAAITERPAVRVAIHLGELGV